MRRPDAITAAQAISDRHRRLDCDAGGNGARTARAAAGRRRCSGHRCGRRGRQRPRQHCCRGSAIARRRRDRTACRAVARLPDRARCGRADRARGAGRSANGRPLDRERWAGALDAVGGATLATILTQLKYRASVAACGLAGGSNLPTTVIPFLLRGVSLLGIDPVMCPREERIAGLAAAGLRSAARSARPHDPDRAAHRRAEGWRRGF